MINLWLYPRFFSLLFRKDERACQRHLAATGRIGAFDRTRPDPGDDSCLAAALRGRDFYFWIEMPDAAERLLLHPLAVVAHIFRKALGALPGAVCPHTLLRLRVHGGKPCKAGRDLDHGLVDHDGDGV